MPAYSSQAVDASSDQTDAYNPSERYKLIDYPFDRYRVKVKLTEDGKFVEIVEIGLSTDFMDYRQKIAALGCQDVEKYYRDEAGE